MTSAVAIRKVTKRWMTGEGAKIRICDMTDKHLLNTIAWCQRAHKKAQSEMPYPQFGGEEAQYQADQEYGRFQDSDPEESFPLYEDLCTEAHRRELTLPESGRLCVDSLARQGRQR